MEKKSIGIVIYGNPDHFPPTINAIHILSEYFDIILVARNQHPPHWQYPCNVKVHCLGQSASQWEIEHTSAAAKLLEYVKFVKQARYFLRNVSLIYAYDAFGYTAAYLSQLLQPHVIPLIYHNHDLSEQLFSLSSLSGWVQRGERRWVHKANILVFPSQARALVFQKLTNFNGRLMIVPNFPRKSFLKEHEDLDSLILERFKKPQILLQGSISRQTSLLELIDSLRLLDRDIQLKLIGPIYGDNPDLITDFATQKNVVDRVKYFKPLPYNELPSHTWMASIGVCLYKKTDINHQTMGTASNKIYEYAACGLPAIVSDQPNYRDNLGDETWVRFANPDDPQSIASAVQDILSSLENYQATCLAARKAFEEKYNYESAFSPLLSKIKELTKYSK
jgi:glycosyltransferase involved in cell wall biosynthesis